MIYHCCALGYTMKCQRNNCLEVTLTPNIYSHPAKKPAIHKVTTMLATSKNVLFPGHNHMLTNSSMVVTWWIAAFLCSEFHSHLSCSFLELGVALNALCVAYVPSAVTSLCTEPWVIAISSSGASPAALRISSSTMGICESQRLGQGKVIG